ncbi:MAG TPA: hypothetical protein VM051_12755 [Usitatibacter sp.]|nr:hypothetical protein [Usitatibacter sp.]
MTDAEILRRRRELVLLSAQLQRATLVRRLDHVQQHPVNAGLRLAAAVATVPILFKVGSVVAGRLARKTRRMSTTEKRRFSVLALLPLLKFLPALKAVLPRIRSFNRTT